VSPSEFSFFSVSAPLFRSILTISEWPRAEALKSADSPEKSAVPSSAPPARSIVTISV